MPAYALNEMDEAQQDWEEASFTASAAEHVLWWEETEATSRMPAETEEPSFEPTSRSIRRALSSMESEFPALVEWIDMARTYEEAVEAQTALQHVEAPHRYQEQMQHQATDALVGAGQLTLSPSRNIDRVRLFRSYVRLLRMLEEALSRERSPRD